MVINVETFKDVDTYCCCISNDDNKVYITETSFIKQRAIDKALSRLYVKLRFQCIDPNSVTLKRINGDEK
jgi:hypothetical protein